MSVSYAEYGESDVEIIVRTARGAVPEDLAAAIEILSESGHGGRGQAQLLPPPVARPRRDVGIGALRPCAVIGRRGASPHLSPTS